MFAQWMYYGYFSNASLAEEQDAIYAKCWVLGAKCMCPAFQNYIVQGVRSQLRGPLMDPYNPRPLTVGVMKHV